MAENMAPDDDFEDDDVAANTEARFAQMREADAELTEIEEAMQGLRNRRKKVRSRLKQETGINLKYFDRMREMAELTYDEQTKAVEDMKDAWNALRPNEQMDFLVAFKLDPVESE